MAQPSLARLRDDVEGRLDDDPGHDLAHALRVALWTVVIGGPLGVDPVRRSPRRCCTTW